MVSSTSEAGPTIPVYYQLTPLPLSNIKFIDYTTSMVALILGHLPSSPALVTSILDYHRPNKVFLCGSRELNSKARSWAYQNYRPYQLSDTDVFRDPPPNLILVFDTKGYRAYEIVFNPTKKVSD